MPRAFTLEQNAGKVADGRTVVVKPCGKEVPTSRICLLAEECGAVEEIQRKRNLCFLTFATSDAARWAVERLNGKVVQGRAVQVAILGAGRVVAGPQPGEREEEFPVEVEIDSLQDSDVVGQGDGGGSETDPPPAAGTAAVSGSVSVSAAAAAAVAVAVGTQPSFHNNNTESSSDCHNTNNTEFTGRYLVKLIRLLNSNNPRSAPLLKVVAVTRNNQAKEVAESFAVVAALKRFAANFGGPLGQGLGKAG